MINRSRVAESKPRIALRRETFGPCRTPKFVVIHPSSCLGPASIGIASCGAPAYVDKGYRGHDAQNPRSIFISGQKRGVFGEPNCDVAPSSPRSATSRPKATSAASISKAAPATPPTPSSPPFQLPTSSHGSGFFCAES
jgi:hypothetical protein